MRTTLTIDEDVAVQIELIRRSEKVSLKDIVNRLFRLGLKSLSEPPPRQKSVRTRSVRLGRCLIGSVDDVAEALAVAEGEGYR